MKKLFILLGTLFLLSVGAYAQKGKQAIGFGLGYGTEIESIGLGIKYQYKGDKTKCDKLSYSA